MRKGSAAAHGRSYGSAPAVHIRSYGSARRSTSGRMDQRGDRNGQRVRERLANDLGGNCTGERLQVGIEGGATTPGGAGGGQAAMGEAWFRGRGAAMDPYSGLKPQNSLSLSLSLSLQELCQHELLLKISTGYSPLPLNVPLSMRTRVVIPTVTTLIPRLERSRMT